MCFLLKLEINTKSTINNHVSLCLNCSPLTILHFSSPFDPIFAEIINHLLMQTYIFSNNNINQRKVREFYLCCAGKYARARLMCHCQLETSPHFTLCYCDFAAMIAHRQFIHNKCMFSNEHG